MSTEEKLKNYILSRYRSVREFTTRYDIPYSTLSSVFTRGINNSSISNIIKLCKALGISTDELAEGRITPITKPTGADSGTIPGADIVDIIAEVRGEVLNYEHITLNGKEIDIVDRLAIASALDAILDVTTRSSSRDRLRQYYEEMINAGL